MDIVLLIKSIISLIAILGILIFLLFYLSSSKNKEVKKPKKIHIKKRIPQPELRELLEVIRNKQATTKALEKALDSIIKYYGKIHPKLGLRVHPDFKIYSEIILRICHHPNTTKEIIIKFDKEIEKLNPEYKREINDSLTKGLNSRGI